MSSTPHFYSSPEMLALIESLESGRSTNEVLSDMARHIEKSSPVKLYASILLLDETGKRLFRGAAPSLPAAYSNQIDGIEIGPNAGSCGTAVFCGHSIYVCDISRDDLWAQFKDLAIPHGLKACWSVPIMSKQNKILGTFALYYDEVRNPTLEERKFIEECAHAAALLIERAHGSRRAS